MKPRRFGGALAALVLLASGCCSQGECDRPCGDGGTDGSSRLDLGPTCVAARQMRVSSDPVVDLFVKGDKLLVVHEHSVALLDAYGRVLVSRAHPSAIHTAALEGEVLAVTDKAAVTVSGPTLQPATTYPLTQACDVTLIVSGPRMLCGRAAKGGYATIDLLAGAELAQSSPGGSWRPLHGLPGTDHFVTISQTVPGDYVLFYIHPGTHELKVVCDDQYGHDKDVSDHLAFDRGSVHMVTSTGVKHRIVGKLCAGSLTDGYFIKDGALVSVPDGSYFLGVDDDDAQGHLVGVLGTGGGLQCKGGCTAIKIEIAADKVLAQQTLDLALGELIRVRYDALCGGLAMAYKDAAGQYRVDRLGLE